jgi:isonocardicin synthase
MPERTAPPDRGTPAWVFEPFDRKPYDLFFLTNGQTRLLGRQQHLEGLHGPGTPPRRSCLVTAPMILGEALREQLTSRGVAVFYRPLPPRDREDRFRALARDERTDLQYPFPAFSALGADEWCSPAGFWRPTPERVRELRDDERPIREVAVELLEGHDLDGKLVFDPACSTGDFLCAIKARHAGARIVGQDRSPEMVEHCRGRLDEVRCGDAREPFLPEASADLVCCRFLNFHVVTTAQAHELFRIVALRCKVGGHLLVAGHTPVLLSAEWFEILGLRVLRRTAHWRERDAVLQLYWLRREGPLRDASALS